MSRRKPGLQSKWSYVVNTLQEIVPSYERASSRISFHLDRRMRPEAVAFAVREGSRVLDLGAGPGTMSRIALRSGGVPVLVDVSRPMLTAASGFQNRVQAVFEHLPFRASTFDAVISGFALRDSEDLHRAVWQISAILKPGGRFSFCDLGKPSSPGKAFLIACYLRFAPGFIGLFTDGMTGLKYSSLFDTYILTLNNDELSALLSHFFRSVEMEESQMGGSIVCKCSK
jgi:ubiquinone/menaquinone biosynthesis C-methylase UbiE